MGMHVEGEGDVDWKMGHEAKRERLGVGGDMAER